MRNLRVGDILYRKTESSSYFTKDKEYRIIGYRLGNNGYKVYDNYNNEHTLGFQFAQVNFYGYRINDNIQEG